MKDRAFLLVTGLLFASLGWAIWHFFGLDSPWVISIVLLVAVIADNARLRRRLRSKSEDDI
ncbi:hypothetical protein [Massilia terrae]|uniref:Uncharacterized protein n=1 Tax=Massilia terrae TaxID=1811224 RepID=A0ABT2D3M1_9BURK|nr:hypothetical protein [Massilia terrae]MCS0659990.1 hypothetical protein [Massilia terrae]